MANNMEIEREGADITAADMLIPDEVPSDIRNYYDGASILLTGGSGFLGTLLIEKLIRTCPGISQIYIILREKKGKTPEQRFEEIFKDIIYEKMITEQPKYYEKITMVVGDCELPDLGLSEKDRKMLIEKVNIVIHAAATVRFDEVLRKATAINVRGTREIMKLSRNMKNLKGLVYVSTAYSHCTLKEVNEIFYDTEMTGDKLIEITEILDDEQLDVLTPTIVGKWPNTYTYTKAIAENVVRQYGQGLPVAIVRPSIVISTAKEPVAGWINNFYGAIGITIGASIGILRTLHCNPDNLADVVPADYCINTVIVAAWVVGQTHSIESNREVTNNVVFDELKMEDDIPIFNYVSSPQNPLTWSRYMELCEIHGLKYPSPQCIWYYFFTLNSNKYKHLLSVIFLHYLPGSLIDFGLYIFGKKPMMLKAYKKIHKFSNVLTYFTIKQWIFKNNNTQTIWKKLNKTDKRLFDFDMSALDWYDYFYTFVRGGRVYLLKDPLETLEKARVKYFKLKLAHYFLISILMYCFYKFLLMLYYYVF